MQKKDKMNEKKYIGNVTLGIKVKRAIWNIVYIMLFRPFPTKLFRKWRIFVLRAFGAKVESNAEVYSSAKIWAPWNLEVKSNGCLGPNTICYNQAMVTIDKDAIVSQYAYLCTAGHDVGQTIGAEAGLIVAPITIGADAWVGTRAFVGMGVTIGEGAVVGATASVFKDVEPWTVVGGNPAKVIKEREICKRAHSL